MPCLALCTEAFGSDEAIPVFGFAIDDTDRMDHAVAVERVVSADGLMHLVLGIANVNAIDIFRNLADDVHVGCVVFVVIGRPPVVHVRMRIRFDSRLNAIDEAYRHES